MDSIRISKVAGVLCSKPGGSLVGTIHLTAHHLIFRYDNDNEEEMWVPYPLISLVTHLPQTLHGQCPLAFHTRTFESFSLYFSKEGDANDVFESVKELTVATSVDSLYAFFYVPNPPLRSTDGWSLYAPREEFGRMGLGSRTKAWRFTDINKDYTFCPTYPARLVVPTKISDTTLLYASKYRSKCRIPVLTYLHWANYGSVTRSSQPMVGITQNRSIQDEKLVEAVFQSHYTPDSRASNVPVYGATATNLIVDARPTANAVANTAKGAGTENMDHYKEAKKAYLGIDHIHAMRESLAKVVEALREADIMSASVSADLSKEVHGLAFIDRQVLRRSGWLRHISAILEGTVLIARNVHINSSHVLIHCSDGWDRTSQLASMAQLCLDPYYRTIHGFQILIEKDWLSYGHKFLDRCGHLSSDKFFVSPSEMTSGSGGTDAAQAFLASVQNRFVSQQHIKETSPIFHQFLESVRQMQRQFPARFEFNERFLRRLHYHLYSCQFGTFLFNSERERRVGESGPPPCDRTVSIWDFFNSPPEKEKNLNPDYDSALDDSTSRSPSADMGVLFPNPKDVRFWHELYGRTDEEMNGRVVTPLAQGVEVMAEGPEDESIRSGTPSAIPLPPSPSVSPSPLSPSWPVGSWRSVSPANMDSSREPSTSQLPVSNASKSLPPTEPTSSPPSPLILPPQNLMRAKPNDFFASSGVKSMWGKLSSNASAALSAVQETYVGVAKDFKVAGGSDRELATTASGEIRDTPELFGGRNDTRPTPSRSASSMNAFGPSSNPWATVTPRESVLSDPFALDNPWSSVRPAPPSPRRAAPPLNHMFDYSSTLPQDPTVAYPFPRTVEPRRSSTSVQKLEAAVSQDNQDRQKNQRPRATASPPQLSRVDSTDPLGVGLS